VEPLIARKLARSANPYPSLVFFAPEVAAAYTTVGLREGRMGYFAGRSAPMGAVPADLVIAAFYSFSPHLVRTYIPAAWSLASPEVILEHRLVATDTALRRVLGDDVVAGPEMKEAARLARIAAEACQPEGRALFAGHASLPWPAEPHLELWHALTLLREHRGDGHLIALAVAGYSGCDAMVMTKAMGDFAASFVATRAWNHEHWAASAESLRSRGLIDGDGGATPAGREHREAVEHQTDLLALPPLQVLGEQGCLRLRELVRPMSITIASAIRLPGARSPHGQHERPR
jgi:hypothetical protein